MSQKRKHFPEPAPTTTDISSSSSDDIFRSAPIDDRSSTFIGYFSPSLSPQALQRLPELKSASHKILAWRKRSNQRSLSNDKTQYISDHDDDGEKHGGKTVEKVLNSMSVAGACVVARWYGGVMLGPVRFAHMEACAREAVRAWQEHEREEVVKRRRVEAEAVEKEDLVAALVERDRSIAVLRALVAEKEEQVKKAIVDGVAALAASEDQNGREARVDEERSAHVEKAAAPTKAVVTVDYSSLTTDRLRALDKARDATLAFLLKRIDKVEADLLALERPPEPP